MANNNSRNGSHFDQVFGPFSKKNSHLNKSSQQDQFSHTATTASNATIVKKNKNLGNKNLSQVE